MMQLLEIENKVENNCYTIILKGEIDASSAKLLDTYMTQAVESAYKNVLVDFKDLEYIASAGIGVFIYHIDEFEAQQKKLILYNINEQIKNVFDILSLGEYIYIMNTETEAKALADQD